MAARVRLDVATLDTLQHALAQIDQPMLHFLPARGYQMNGMAIGSRAIGSRAIVGRA